MKQKTTLQLKITHKDGDRELYLSADNMDELIDKIIDFQQWENQSFNRLTDEEKAKEKQSGWYCLSHSINSYEQTR